MNTSKFEITTAGQSKVHEYAHYDSLCCSSTGGGPRKAVGRNSSLLDLTGYFRATILLPLLLLILVFLPRPAQAAFVFLNSNSFGANSGVIAELGTANYTTGCASGVNDFILTSTNIYVIQRGEPGAGAALGDVSNASGIPNAWVGSSTAGFIGEVLGNTAPGGYIISGDYAVVLDECQNNKYDPGQDFYGALFSVSIPANVDPLQTAAFAAQLAATKAAATIEANHAQEAFEAFDALFQYFMVATIIGAATDPIDFVLFSCSNIDPVTLMPFCSTGAAIQGLIDLRAGMAGVMLTNVLHYEGIAADPPDPAFTLLPVLDGGLTADLDPGDPMMTAAFRFGEATSEVESLTEAFLHAMERYQGAEAAGNGEYAFVQARQMEDYARALAEAVPRANAAFQAVAAATAGNEASILDVMNDLRATQARVAATGLTTEENLRLLALGWSQAQIDAEVANYLTNDFSGFQTATAISDLAASLSASEASTVAAFTDFANVIVTAQTNLAAQLRLPFPDADAGGPYVVNEGVALALDATASSHPDLANSALEFGWDLDLDGVFDDASGETPIVTFDHERDGLIGLRVTAPTGYADVSYALVTVNDVNGPPQITASNPGGQVVIASDGNQTFDVTATDPDGDTLSYAWFLDGVQQASTTNSYAYLASVPDAGEHVVSLTVSDGSPNSLDVRQFWGLQVLAPDVDGDGYPSNVDCDDSDADVNPGQAEIFLNGIDDDCNPATPDDPDLDDDGYDYLVDCDESNASINPGATEVCNFIDDNCNGQTDEGFDADSDGVTSCGGDCDDSDAGVYPGATEVCNLIDDNCDSIIDENFDVDGDGVTSCGGDCDDLDASNFPGNVEVCDLQDNNCDFGIDEGFDTDADGFSVCAPVADCDDADSSVYPGAPELCDALDNDCDGGVDEGVNDDLDGDGQSACAGDCDDGDALNFSGNTEVCDNQDNNCVGGIDDGFDVDNDGFTICSLPAADCDDADSSNYPGNPEICDLQDNNCDGTVDEGFDLDGDGFSLCSTPVADCDDSEAASFPGNAEICDGVDNNCDGAVDEGFDLDGDGFSICSGPVADCDDSNADVYPGRPEVLHNGRDDDCDAGTLEDYADTFIIIPGDAGRIYYARSNGDGTWADYRLITQLSGAIRGAAIADYDADGDLDFVLGSPSGNSLRFHLFENDGADNFTDQGVFATGSNAGSYQMDMTAGDFDHDGDMDFRSNGNSSYMHVGQNDGTGNFTLTTINTGLSGSGRGMDTADFNHDGHLDLARATYSSGQVILLLGDGSGNFTSSGVIGDPGTDPYGVTAADFNNDGHPDVMANDGGGGNVSFFAGNGDGTFLGGVVVASADHNNHGAFDNYDFNRDGNQDLVATSYTSRKIYYYPGNGDGTFGAAVQVNPSNTAGNILGISAPPGPPPAGDPRPLVTPNPYIGTKGDTVDLSGEYSTDDGSIVSYEWDFGDGSTGVGRDVSHAFPNVEDDYRVSLRVTDDEGKVAIDTGLVFLTGDPPTADAGGPYTFGEDFAVGGVYTVTLDGSGSSDDGADPLAYAWDLGDSFNEDFASGLIDPGVWSESSASVSAEEATVIGAGWGNSYLVTQRTFPRRAEVSTFTGRVGTVVNPTVMWGLKNTNDNYSYTQFPYAIYFNSNSWIYIYEDGASRGNKVQYTEGADYEVRIDVKPGSGANYYFRAVGSTNWVTIYESNHSSLSTFRLGATVSGGAIRLDDFDRRHGSSNEMPTVVYSRQDTFDVSLTVTDIADQSDTDSTTVETVAGDRPVAHPGGPYTPGEANASCGAYTVAFDGSASSDDSGRIYKYDWDFGDGGTGTGVAPSHSFAAGGPVPDTYTVTLTVTDHALQQNTLTTTTSVNPAPGAFPVAITGNYSVDESAASAGMWTVNFDGSASSDDVGLCDYVWDFGDGGSGSGPTPSHQYSAAGDYTGTLTVRDHALQSHQVSFNVQVTVNDPPVASDGGPYAVDESAAQNGQWTVNLDASGSSDDFGVWTWGWDFGDGNTGSGETVTHAYAGAGTYIVALTVTDNGGQTHTTTTQVTVSSNDPPVADAGPNILAERGFPVTLDASGSSDDFGILSYEWDFGVTPTFAASSGASVVGDTMQVTGASGWGSRYLYSLDSFPRVAGDSYSGTVDTATSTYVMWGLKNDNTNPHYNQYPHAMYFHNNSWIYIYEDGSSRGNKVTYTKGQSYDVRIDVKATGATYYYRASGTSSWTLVYDSAHSSTSPMRMGADVNTGTIGFSDFVTPAGPLPLIINGGSSQPVVSTTYLQTGTYQPTVTVTDQALQADSDSTTVTIVEGDAPVADAGGPYLTNEDIPTRFNGRGSSDDFGIKTYNWDFGDGTTLTSRNPFADHRYTAVGSYTVTLTVTDYAGHTGSDSDTVNVSADPVVAAVPWRFSGGLEVPHDTWSGNEARLKAVAWSLNEPLTYEWDFGDGSAPVTGTVANKNFIEARHTYTGVDGKPFIATIKITDANGVTVSDQYLLRIRARSLDIETNVAIDNGLWYLHGRQSRSESAGILYGQWAFSAYTASPTASATQAFEINGHLELGDVTENPYVETVSRGLHSMFAKLNTTNIGVQTYGDPDSNSNGIGVQVNSGRPIYEGGMIMDAIAGSGSANTYADTGPSGVVNRTYADIAQDMIDEYAWGQYDSATVGGGWRYSWNQHPDNSAAQWGAIGVLALKQVFGQDIQQWAKDRNDVWLNYSYSGAGFGYTGAGTGQALTPSGMVQMPMNDLLTSDPRWVASESTVTQNWGAWYRHNCNYYALFALTKAMRLALPGPIVNLTGPGTYSGLDWFSDPTSGIARTLIDDNFATSNGSFGGVCGHATGDLASAWGVIMLTPTLFVQPPVADAGSNRVWGVDVPITLDASGSFHQDPFRNIVLYEWDVDGDGEYDSSGTSPTITHTYATADYPEPSLPQTVTVRLRVTDDNDPSQTDTDTVNIIIAVPPHPPVADIGGPYSCTAGLPCKLDGSGSFDIDPTDFITAWDWDLDNDGEYDDATGVQPDVVFPDAGQSTVGLRVRDNAVLNDENGNGVQDPEEQLADFDFISATVHVNNPPVADPNGPYTVDEGSSFQLDGSASFDPDGNPITFAWDLDDDGNFDDETTVNPTVSWPDDGTYTIGLEVSDSLLTDSMTTLVIVENVAPLVDAGTNATINEGDTFVGGGSFTDPGADTWTATVDYGDGSGQQPLALNPDGSFALGNTYADNGVYTVTVTVTDDDGGVGVDTAQVTVRNVAPAVDAGPDATFIAGGSLASVGSFSDPGSDSWTATVDYGDGTAVQPLALNPDMTFSLSHAYPVSGIFEVTVTVTDDDGGVGVDTAQVVVIARIAPLVDAGPDSVLNEGDTFDSVGSFSDSDSSSWTATVDYGDGTGVQSLDLNQDMTFSLNHNYPVNGIFEVTVTVTDGEGGVGEDTAQVTVNDVALVVDAGPDSALDEGDTFISAGSFSDLGSKTWTATVDYGDGTGVQALALTPNKTFNLSHLYADDGVFVVTVIVTDDGGSIGVDTAQVTVGNVAPVVDAGPDAAIDVGSTFVSAGSFSDPGSDTWTATVDYGDGTGVQALALNQGKTFSLSHPYSEAGVFEVTVTVTDDDGGVGVDTAQVTVADDLSEIMAISQPDSVPGALKVGTGSVPVRFTVSVQSNLDRSLDPILLRGRNHGCDVGCDETETLMNDDGIGGDLEANDGIFTVIENIDTDTFESGDCRTYVGKGNKLSGDEVVSEEYLLCATHLPIDLAESDTSEINLIPFGDATVVGNEILVRLEECTSTAALEEALRSYYGIIVGTMLEDCLFQVGFDGILSPQRMTEIMEFLRQQPGVVEVDPNYVGEFTSVPSDPEFGNQHGLQLVSADSLVTEDRRYVWDAGATGAGVRVIVLDSGVSDEHPDDIDPLAEFSKDRTDLIGHGSGMAGIIGATTDNGTAIAAMARDARIRSVRISKNNNVTLTKMLNGFKRAKGYAGRNKVVSASFSISNMLSDGGVCRKINQIINRGSVVVVSAGNNNDNAKTGIVPGNCNSTDFDPFTYPRPVSNANKRSLIVVGATACTSGACDTDSRWTESGSVGSNYGNSWVDISAPGVNIPATFADGSTANVTGTSPSAALVAGAAAILRSCEVGGSLDATTNLNLRRVFEAMDDGAVGPVSGLPKRLNVYHALASVNTLPTEILLSVGEIVDGTDTTGGFEFAEIMVSDETVCDAHSIEISGGADGDKFSIGGDLDNRLVIDDGILNSSAKPVYEVEITVHDFYGGSLSQMFNIVVTPP